MALANIAGSGGGGAFVDGDRFTKTTGFDVLRETLRCLMLGILGRNQYGGGSDTVGFAVGSGTGQLTAIDCVEFEIDNSSSQLSGSSGVVIQVRVSVRTENATMSVTPQVYNITDSSVPTQSGAAACIATADDYSGLNQKQTITLTPATGKKKYVVQVQKSADTYIAWCARITWDIYIA